MLAVLMYEPDNAEAVSFQPLIEQKLTLGLTPHTSAIVFSPFMRFQCSDAVCWASGTLKYRYISREALPRRNAYWLQPFVCLSVCPSLHSHATARTQM